MKITCNACGAKYTIADEKVQGKRVKVRCKSCKASILVDGTGGAGGEGEADEAVDEAADLAKIPALSLGPVMPGTGLAGAPAGGEAPAPAGLGGDAKKPPERKPVKKNAWSVNLTDDDSREMTTEELVAGWKSGLVTRDAYVWKDGMDDWKPILDVPELKLRLKAVTPPAAAAAAAPVVTSAARAPAAPAGGAADLFGGADFGSSSDTTTSAQDKKAAPAGPVTGARNESSVLFSLDALKAQGPTEKEERSNPNDLFAGLGGGGLGGGLGGGMLGGSADLLTAPAKDPPPAPAGARAVPIASPSFDAPPAKGKGGLIAAVLGGVLVLGGGAFFMTQGGGDDATQAAVAEAEAKAKADSEAAEAEKKKLEEEKAKAEDEKKKLEEKLKAAEAAAAKKDEPAPAEPKKDEPAPAAAAPAAGAKPAAGGDKPAAAAPAAPAAGAGPFDTAAAKAALSTAAAGAASCAQPGGPTGSGKAEVTFAPSGRVTSANVVSGPFGGTPVGGCIASTFRKARVPAFSGAPVTVAKSFSVK